jgi:hypothetical protein
MRKPQYENLIGKEYDRLIVEEYAGSTKGGRAMWLCKCKCGNYKIIVAASLKRKLTGSCGCKQKEIASKLNKSHGLGKTTEYSSWTNMQTRCRNPNFKDWHLYGGKGIKVCERWNSFENFLEDMGKKPGKGYSIERRDSNKDYTPENCYWATSIEQANNTSKNLHFEWNGKLCTIRELADLAGLPHGTLYQRLYTLKWPLDVAMKVPYKGKL